MPFPFLPAPQDRNSDDEIAAWLGREQPRPWTCIVVPTIGFNLLYVLVIVWLARRELVWIDVTGHPTTEWIARHAICGRWLRRNVPQL